MGAVGVGGWVRRLWRIGGVGCRWGAQQSQASFKTVPQSIHRGNGKASGWAVLFCFVLFFVTLLIQPWPTTETWEGQTNRLTQIHTETHNQNTFTFPFQNHNQPEMFRLPTIRDTHTHQWTCWQSLLKHTACRLKRQHWEWEENRMATTIETVWGAQRNTPATTDCWHTNTRIRAG